MKNFIGRWHLIPGLCIYQKGSIPKKGSCVFTPLLLHTGKHIEIATEQFNTEDQFLKSVLMINPDGQKKIKKALRKSDNPMVTAKMSEFTDDFTLRSFTYNAVNRIISLWVRHIEPNGTMKVVYKDLLHSIHQHIPANLRAYENIQYYKKV